MKPMPDDASDEYKRGWNDCKEEFVRFLEDYAKGRITERPPEEQPGRYDDLIPSLPSSLIYVLLVFASAVLILSLFGIVHP